MFKYIVQFLILFVLLYSNKRAKGKWLVSTNILLGIYVFGALMGVIDLNIHEFNYARNSNYWFPMLAFDIILLAFLLPFRQFKETNIRSIVLPSKSFLDIFSTIIIILSFYSIIFFAGSVRNIFSLDNLSDARNDMLGGEMYFEAGTMATIATVSAAQYVFAIVLYFVYRIIGNSGKRCTLLLIASIAEPLHILSFVGRDGVVFWIFTFAFCYAFFYPYLSYKNKRKLIKTIGITGCILLIPFLAISVSRFGGSDTGTMGSIVAYLGEQFIRGPAFFAIENKPINYASVFPLYREITGMHFIPGDHHAVYGDWIAWHFSTFVVGLYISLGLVGLIVLAVCYNLLFKMSFGWAKRQLHFGQFTIYLLYFQVISQGVFYFRHSTRGGNLFIITTLLIAMLFSFAEKCSSKPIVLHRLS